MYSACIIYIWIRHDDACPGLVRFPLLPVPFFNTMPLAVPYAVAPLLGITFLLLLLLDGVQVCAAATVDQLISLRHLLYYTYMYMYFLRKGFLLCTSSVCCYCCWFPLLLYLFFFFFITTSFSSSISFTSTHYVRNLIFKKTRIIR